MIRKMEKADIFQICDIENHTFTEPWSRDSFLETMKRPENIYLVYEEEGSILGYCGLWGILDEGQVTNIAVKEGFRGRGIGGAILTELIREGKESGLKVFTLEVRQSNQAALSLYHKVGFEEAAVRKDFYRKPTEDAFIMWLNDTSNNYH